jgi:hypothetical protein
MPQGCEIHERCRCNRRARSRSCSDSFTPLGATLGFVRPPAVLFAVLAATVLAYLGAAEAAKRWFYRHPAAAT